MSALHTIPHPSRRLSSIEIAQVVRDFKEDISIATIVRKYGMARLPVYRALERGVPSKAGAHNVYGLGF